MAISEKRLELVKEILEDETNAEVEEEIIHILLQEQVSKESVTEHDNRLTMGQKAADNLAKFAGSWFFITIFFAILILWIGLNTLFLKKPFDLYPFILLNLILSCLASIQAPVIMMSQNRQEEKDRIRAKNDYKVNLKAEIIIEDLHYKLDTILEMQEDILNRLKVLEERSENSV